jgi:hypothetical protein
MLGSQPLEVGGLGDVVTEVMVYRSFSTGAIGGILDGVVQQAGDGGVLVPAVFEHERGHGHDVGQVRAGGALADLCRVDLAGEAEGALEAAVGMRRRPAARRRYPSWMFFRSGGG